MICDLSYVWRLPESVMQNLFVYYIVLEATIAIDCAVAGIEVTERYYHDDDWARYFTFATREALNQFVDMAGYEDHPSGYEWEILDDPDADPNTLWIPRLDLRIASQNLKRLNEITVEDYEAKWDSVWEKLGD